jgi:hypothetical protein
MYLDTIRSQIIATVAMLQDENYRRSLMNDVEFERKRKNEMSLQAAELDAEVYMRISHFKCLPVLSVLHFID